MLRQFHAVLEVSAFVADGVTDPLETGTIALRTAFSLWSHKFAERALPGQPNLYEVWSSPSGHEIPLETWKAPGGVLERALLEPPYGLFRLNGQQRHAPPADLFQDFLQAWVFRPGPAPRLYEWSVDWSPYFKDGLEWWGSFCWTLHHPDRVTVVVASSTD